MNETLPVGNVPSINMSNQLGIPARSRKRRGTDLAILPYDERVRRIKEFIKRQNNSLFLRIHYQSELK